MQQYSKLTIKSLNNRMMIIEKTNSSLTDLHQSIMIHYVVDKHKENH